MMSKAIQQLKRHYNSETLDTAIRHVSVKDARLAVAEIEHLTAERDHWKNECSLMAGHSGIDTMQRLMAERDRLAERLTRIEDLLCENPTAYAADIYECLAGDAIDAAMQEKRDE